MIRAAVLLAIGTAIGVAAAVAAQAPPALKREDPPYRSLDANLFMQTAAEYRACCLQAYNLATEKLAAKVKAKEAGGKPPAVVLDLDETVFDNGGFQAMMIRSGLAYDQRLWDIWEEKHGENVGLIPGAKDFRTHCDKHGVATVYITNRNEKYRAGAKAALDRLSLTVPDGQLLLATTTSDKTARRAKAAEAFDVLLLIGDNLRDLDEAFKFDKQAGIAGRAAVVDANRAKFGTDWVILPNPAYGEWAKAFPGGAKDADLLMPAAAVK